MEGQRHISGLLITETDDETKVVLIKWVLFCEMDADIHLFVDWLWRAFVELIDEATIILTKQLRNIIIHKRVNGHVWV